MCLEAFQGRSDLIFFINSLKTVIYAFSFLMGVVLRQIWFYKNRLIIVESNYFDSHPKIGILFFHFYASINNLVYNKISFFYKILRNENV